MGTTMCDGMTPKVLAVGLTVLTSLLVCGVGGLLQAAAEPASKGCFHSPTARCVIGLSLATAESISDASVRAGALARIAGAQVAAGEIGEARKSLSRALTAAAAIDNTPYNGEVWLKYSPDDYAYHDRARVFTDTARVLVGMGVAEEGQEMFSRALAAAGKIETDHYRAESLVRIAKAQIATGGLQEARETLAQASLADNGWFLLDPSDIARAQAEAGDVAGALVTANALDPDERPEALADVAATQAAAGDVPGAMVTAGGIEHSYYGMLAMHYIGTAQATAGDIAGAWDAVGAIMEIWDHVRDGHAGPRDTTILHSDTLLAIAEAHAAAGEFEKVLAAAGAMEDPLAFTEAHAAVAEAQTKTGDFNAARVSAEATCGWQLRYGGRCVEVLAGIAVAQAAAGNIEEGREVLSQAQDIAEEVRYTRARMGAFVAIHAARFRMGDPDGAKQAFSQALTACGEFEYPWDRTEEFTAMGVAAARQGHAEGAEQAFSLALAAAGQIKDLGERVKAFVQTGLAWTDVGDPHGAREAFSRAVTTARVIDPACWRVKLLADIASAMVSGRWPETDDLC